jgi:pimeloyl-ACP methyl ester carboxylesterase
MASRKEQREQERRERLGHFVNPAVEREYLELYDALRDEYFATLVDEGCAAAQTRDVESCFGTTRTYHWPGAGTPIVLLHGAGASSLMWVPLVVQLAGLDVYALDAIGEPGRSVQRAPLPDRDALVAWLDACLDELGLEHVHLAGASYGGWLALCYAQHGPGRLATLMLLEPALAKPRPYFFVYGLMALVSFAMPRPLGARMLRRLHMGTIADAGPRATRYGRLGLMKYRRGVPRGVVPVTDDELAATATPTLVLLGGSSELHRADRVAARMREHMSRVEVEIVPDAGHALPLEDAPRIGPTIRRFLGAPSAEKTLGST